MNIDDSVESCSLCSESNTICFSTAKFSFSGGCYGKRQVSLHPQKIGPELQEFFFLQNTKTLSTPLDYNGKQTLTASEKDAMYEQE